MDLYTKMNAPAETVKENEPMKEAYFDDEIPF
jgi:hypothetical protein